MYCGPYKKVRTLLLRFGHTCGPRPLFIGTYYVPIRYFCLMHQHSHYFRRFFNTSTCCRPFPFLFTFVYCTLTYERKEKEKNFKGKNCDIINVLFFLSVAFYLSDSFMFRDPTGYRYGTQVDVEIRKVSVRLSS